MLDPVVLLPADPEVFEDGEEDEQHRIDEEAQKAIDFYWHEGQDVSQYLNWSDASKLKTLLANTTSTALNAWSAGCRTPPNHKTAITKWKSIFGQRFPGYG